VQGQQNHVLNGVQIPHVESGKFERQRGLLVVQRTVLPAAELLSDTNKVLCVSTVV